jgi:hypothetical protein
MKLQIDLYNIKEESTPGYLIIKEESTPGPLAIKDETY